MLILCFRQELIQGLELTGGVTSHTIFPKTEDRLNETDVQEALDNIMKRKNAEKYRSLMDFIFCELFPEPWRWKCFRFYNGKGPLFINDNYLIDAIAKAYDIFMAEVFIEICLKTLNQERWISWSSIRNEALLLLAA